MHKQLLDARQQLQAKEELQSEMAALKTQVRIPHHYSKYN